MSEVEYGFTCGEGSSSSGRLLRDIEEISKALYLKNTQPNALSSPPDRRSKSAGKARVSESKLKYVKKDLLQKDRKGSIWNWKPLKALTHIRNHRFNCYFFLHVHAAEGLPSNFNDLSLCVHWKWKAEVLRTRTARVCQGVAEFEETLMHRCSVYGSKSGSNIAKYEPKLFLLYASVVGAPGLDIGMHQIDLTRLLPLTFEELADNRSSGKWTTSFKLAGKAKGGMLNVSFGFSALGDSVIESSNSVKVPGFLKDSESNKLDQLDLGRNNGHGMLRRLGSVPNNSNRMSHLPSHSLDLKVVNQVFPDGGSELTQSVTFLYEKLDEGKLDTAVDFNFFYKHFEPLNPDSGSSPESGGENSENESDKTEFTVIEQGIELPVKNQTKLKESSAPNSDGPPIESIDMSEMFKCDGKVLSEAIRCDSVHEVYGNLNDETMVDGSSFTQNSVCTKEATIAQLDSVSHKLSISEPVESDLSIHEEEFLEQKNCRNSGLSHDKSNLVKSLSFGDASESVANEFLNLLGIERISLGLSSESDPESPRERLLRQFEKDALASGEPLFDFDGTEEQVEFSDASLTSYGWGDCSDDFDLSLLVQTVEKEHDLVSQSLRSRREAKMLENLESEALMREWGLNEKAFQNSPRTSSGGFGSPVYLSPEAPPQLPPLGEGVGPVIQTKDGGFLRSMSPSLFRNAKNGESLIMQVSGPLVLPAAMGSSAVEILQHWALAGAEKMTMQANELMPLEDITGKTMQQVAWEAESKSEVLVRLNMLLHDSETVGTSFDIGKEVEELPSSMSSDNVNSSSVCSEMDMDHVFLKDLVPLAMDKIENLFLEGLRIQSDLSAEEAPSNIRLQCIRETSASTRKTDKLGGSLCLDGTVDDVDELIRLSVSLDEWMRLDALILGDEGGISARISKVLVAHHSKHVDLNSGTRDDKLGNVSSRRCGFLGDNFTIALTVQLRDPFRNYETVGATMLALIEIERVYVPLRPDIHHTESEKRYNCEVYDEYEDLVVAEFEVEEKESKNIQEEFCSQFKIVEVHVAGLSAELCKKQLWGIRTEQKSGSRWLFSSGLAKTNKHLFLNSNAIVTSSSQMMRKVRPMNTLWSISSLVHGAGYKWKELATLNLHTRNPDIVFLEEANGFLFL